MPTLDSSVGGIASNSYLSQAQALELAPLVLGALPLAAFIAATSDQKDVSLMRATRMIERSFEWFGFRWDSYQALSWPRYGVYEDGILLDNDIIPKGVQDALVLMASHVLSGYTESDGLSTAASSVKVGPISVSLDTTKSRVKSVIPEDVISALSKYGEYTGITSGAKAIGLERG